MSQSKVQPFNVSLSADFMSNLRTRIALTRWPVTPSDDENWNYGTDKLWLQRFANYWASEYQQSTFEKSLNRFQNFVADVNGLDIHFLHLKASASNGKVILLTHGWPGSVVEFLDSAERLAWPERFGGKVEDAFDVVIPSLPGYGYSSKPKSPMGPRGVAGLWRQLMTQVLGYPQFFAQGGDWGAAVTSWLGAEHSEVVRAIHLNMLPSWFFVPSAKPDPEEINYFDQVTQLRAFEMGYFSVQSTKPATIGFALEDSPVGFAAWICEKFHRWADTHGQIDSRFDFDTLITNLMMYVATDSVASSLWMYKGRAEEVSAGHTLQRIEIPTGIALFPAEIIPYPPRKVAETLYNVQQWSLMEAGGHFAALEEPKAFADELRSFFLKLSA